MGDASSSSADPLVEASQDAAPDTAKHSPPPPGADLPKASALKGSQSNDVRLIFSLVYLACLLWGSDLAHLLA